MLMPKSNAEETALVELLDRYLQGGRVRFILPDRTLTAGKSAPEGAELALRVKDPAFFGRVVGEGNLGLAETWMDRGWEMEEGSLEGFLTLLAKSRLDEAVRLDRRMMARMGALRVKQLLRGGRANIAVHYDQIGDDLYETFLDETRGYSCGYQKSPDDDVRQLQENKYDRICQKLRLREGETFFDIGCGYGGLVIHAAAHYGVRARGITNSAAHGAFARKRIRELGLEGKANVEVGDFRAARGVYDKVASVGAFEHLYPHEHRAFFGVFTRILAPEGWGLLHTIGCVSARNEHDPFIQKYIFPGSTQNPLSVIARGLERHKLAIVDVENIARHYAPTSRAWLERFRANMHRLDPARYDARFLRMWEYYLACCVAASSATDSALWHVLVTKSYRRDLPMIRV